MLVSVSFASAQIKSVYTKLDEKSCKSLKPDKKNGETGALRCGGVGGYWLRVISGPDDSVAELITPSGKEFATDSTFAGHHVASGTSEWRVKNGRPVGLIVRYSVQEPEGFKSYLVVSKISRSGSCVVGIASPGKAQNAEARKLADGSHPCNSSPGN
jgi:hypothetical protein